VKPIQITMFGEPKIKALAEDQKPAYRIRNTQARSYRELLAVLVGGPMQIETADSIALRWPTAVDLKRATEYELANIQNVGEATAKRVVAAMQLGRLAAAPSLVERPTIHSPADAAALVQYEMSSLDQEHLRVILLDTRTRVMDIVEVYKGSLNRSQVRVAELFSEAVRRNACSIIVAHNHPSGLADPSPDDVAVTRAIVQAGKLLDIECLDHIIVGGDRFVSLKKKGLGFQVL
jgi:DNA repair protein RadC